MRSASTRLVHVTLACLCAVAAAGPMVIGADPGVEAAGASCPPSAMGGNAAGSLPPGSPPPGDCAPAPSESPAPTDVVTVTAHDVYFDPSELTISSQGTTTIRLVDKGVVVHNFTVDALGGTLTVAQPGRSSEATIVDPPPGVYQFYCSVSGHREAGMVGTLTVLAPSDAGAGTGATAVPEEASPAPSPEAVASDTPAA